MTADTAPPPEDRLAALTAEVANLRTEIATLKGAIEILDAQVQRLGEWVTEYTG